MNHDNRFTEDNTARLIVAGFGAEARPGEPLRAATLQSLTSRIKTRHSPAAFPQPVLYLLLGALMVMAVGLGSGLMQADISVAGSLANPICATALLLNLTFVPVAGVVIVIRRRNVQPT